MKGGLSAGCAFQLGHQDRLLGVGGIEADLREWVPSAEDNGIATYLLWLWKAGETEQMGMPGQLSIGHKPQVSGADFTQLGTV